ncbi:hypothetical protein ODI84_01555 [Pseudomonas putida]|uniref:Uncharacterized protein n=1 Tax=Pseudomonas putida TaxID=303 RepID=A0A1X1A4F5_PSEPU|nr:hypothetical protein [Pseudomonas putida]MEB3898862.1 hypothetical protein [Pseudomonas putida]ORL66814.1 hypothetical protein B7H17_03970 [Pseudomonas putida]
MDHIDDQTRHKIREWQVRRLEIKDLMAAHPERVLELTKVLDQMEEEHERILGEAEVVSSDKPVVTSPGGFELQLRVSAGNARHLRKLLEMALYELDGVIEADGEAGAGQAREYPGGMSGSLGAYEYALQVAASAEPCAVE